MEFGDGAQWLVIPLQIFFVDLLLGADNALLVALACRSLDPDDARRAVTLGTAGAIALRLVLTVLASSLLAVPFVKLAGAWVLIVIALSVAGERGHVGFEQREDSPAGRDLWSAALLIIVADAAMSLDNIVALAAIARGNFWLLAAGVAFSIPVLAYGGLVLSAIVRNAPFIVMAGAALLGWVAGDMAVSDALIAHWAETEAPGLVALAPALGAAFVLAYAWLRPTSAPKRQPTARAPVRRTAMRAPTPPPDTQRPAPAESRMSAAPPAAHEDRVALIGVLILAALAGVALTVIAYIDSQY